MNRTAYLLCLLLALLSAAPAFAEASADEAYRYDSFMMEGVLHRFDKKTGTLERLSRNGGKFEWSPVEVQVSSRAPSAPRRENSSENAAPPANTGSSRTPGATEFSHLSEDRKNAPVLFDENDKDITDEVTDADRKNALPFIASYVDKLPLIQALSIGDRITGTVVIRNNGEKRLRAMEVTMSLQVVGREKPEEHRFLFVNKPGAKDTPPQPADSGKDARPLIQRVDVLCPAGGIKGSPEIKITYLKFE